MRVSKEKKIEEWPEKGEKRGAKSAKRRTIRCEKIGEQEKGRRVGRKMGVEGLCGCAKSLTSATRRRVAKCGEKSEYECGECTLPRVSSVCRMCVKDADCNTVVSRPGCSFYYWPGRMEGVVNAKKSQKSSQATSN